MSDIKNVSQSRDFVTRNKLALQRQIFEEKVHETQAKTLIDLSDTMTTAVQGAGNILSTFRRDEKNNILSETRFKYLYEKLRTKIVGQEEEIDAVDGKLRKQREILNRMKKKRFYLDKKRTMAMEKLCLERDDLAVRLDEVRRRAHQNKRENHKCLKRLTSEADAAVRALSSREQLSKNPLRIYKICEKYFTRDEFEKLSDLKLFWDHFNTIQCSVDDLRDGLTSLNAERSELQNRFKEYLNTHSMDPIVISRDI